jgi:hypothetical protein
VIDQSLAQPARGPTPEHAARERRALALFEERGHLITRVASDLYEVPSGEYVGRRYFVRYGGPEESCSCADFQYRGEDRACKHLLMVGIMHAARRRGVREVRDTRHVAGDPFAHAGKRRGCAACYEGWVYLGFEREEDGELVEITDRVPCRRCQAQEALMVLVPEEGDG